MFDAFDARLGGLNFDKKKEKKSDTRHGFAFFIVKYN